MKALKLGGRERANGWGRGAAAGRLDDHGWITPSGAVVSVAKVAQPGPLGTDYAWRMNVMLVGHTMAASFALLERATIEILERFFL